MPESSQRADEALERWEQGPLADTLARCPERHDQFRNDSARRIDRLYLPEHVDEAYLDRLGFPGEPPFTRGVHPSMYRGRLWTVRQYAGFGTAEATNERFRQLLARGNRGLSVAFDLPTQIGYDSDHPLACGEVGRVGVAVDSLADMRALFDRIPLGTVSTSMTINATASILLAMYVVVAEEQGVEAAKLTGTLQNDILKEYAARGTYRFPPGPSLRLTSDVFAYCSKHLPKFNSISVSGYHMREAGATAAQEIGFTLANAICYLDTAIRAGLTVDGFAPQLTFFLAVHSDFFEEIAKFRAARRLYARIMKGRFGAKNVRSCMFRVHSQTGGVTLTAQQPDNNVTRVALQALAAVLGGTQSLHTNAKDEALSLPSSEAVEVALNTQHIIANEIGVTQTVDPLAGSYFVERLTDELEAEAEEIIRKIDELGGAEAAIAQGWVQAEIERAAYEFGQRMERGERLTVGVNAFQKEEPSSESVFRVPEDTLSNQSRRLVQVRANRDPKRVDAALEAIRSVAGGDGNLMPPIVDAVRAETTIGEICDSLVSVFGEHDASSG